MIRGFFIRAKADQKETVLKAIPGGEIVTVEGRSEDFGYLTPAMSEKQIKDKLEELSDAVLGMIRLEK